jgi:glycerol kinase
MSVLAIDVGTTGVRSAIVRPDARVDHLLYQALPPSTPSPGLVEFDPHRLAATVLELAQATLDRGGPVTSVGIATQRASTVVWDPVTGRAVGPGLGWQDLRTVLECITARSEHDLHLAPNQSATKIRWLLDHAGPGAYKVGTIDTWLAWVLTQGQVHVTDRTNAGVTGLCLPDVSAWSSTVCDTLEIPLEILPQIVDSSSPIGIATALTGSPPLTALVGDQQASLVGQGCVTPGRAKVTFGTGAMLDLTTDRGAPAQARRHPHGTIPIVTWSRGGEITYGAEAVMLTAGACVDWLRDDLGLITTANESHEVASRCEDTDGVVFVPALLGTATPDWDYGARGALFGMTRGTERTHIVRAVLEGIAQRSADLLAAGEADTGASVEVLRVDGGMSRNPTFVQAVADATQRTVEVSPVVEATTLGAAFLAGVEAQVWADLDETAATWAPLDVVTPQRQLDRDRWRRAVHAAGGWIPDLSALDF